MKKHVISTLCLSLLLAGSYVHAQDAVQPTSQLSKIIDESLFSPTSALKLTHQEMCLLANATLLMYMESHYILRSHITALTEQVQHRKEVIQKTCAAALAHIKANGSAQLKVAIDLLEHNTKSLKRTYLNKYQEELISGERDTFVHAQALQQVTVNLFGLWYKAIYEGMKNNNFEANCFKIVFNQDGLITESARTGELPAPNQLM